MSGRRIGILGGTFDPVHIGHLVVAMNARYRLSLDAVLLMVANEPWQKTGEREISPARDRLALAQAAVSDLEGVEASALEIERGGPTYTADTVEALHAAEPDACLFVIVGADVAASIATWKRLSVVEEHAQLVVVNRPGSRALLSAEVAFDGPHGVRHIEVPGIDVSGTELRRRVAEGEPLKFLIPDQVMRLISTLGLYARSK